jgi:hypothetical protein
LNDVVLICHDFLFSIGSIKPLNPYILALLSKSLEVFVAA